VNKIEHFSIYKDKLFTQQHLPCGD